jgi:hypothetical protein
MQGISYWLKKIPTVPVTEEGQWAPHKFSLSKDGLGGIFKVGKTRKHQRRFTARRTRVKAHSTINVIVDIMLPLMVLFH